MIFTSYTYLVFLASVFVAYWLVPFVIRKPLLVVASYVFYCSWKWEFGFLLLGVSLLNWSYARWVLARRPTARLLALGIVANLAPLVYFKYTNFFLQNVVAVSSLFQNHISQPELDIILPLGISFFTFQGIAYLFHVATGEQPLTRLLDFLLFKSFWPQLIAGPIVRLDDMRAQLQGRPTLTYEDFAFGCQRIVFGFFKKVVLADTLAPSVDMVFLSKASPNGVDAVAAILGFGLQIYLDFSAYSDIAIGSARLLGYRLPENFAWPYISRSPQEFWNRWHITLSRWIRDYVYTPLRFATRDHPRFALVWLLCAMALCGLWHGANWTFVIWGVWHGALLVVNRTFLRGFFGSTSDRVTSAPLWGSSLSTVATFGLVSLGWVFFRSQSLSQAGDLLRAVFSVRGGIHPSVLRENDVLVVGLIFCLLLCAHLVQVLPVRRLTQTTVATGWLQLAKPLAYALACVLVVVFNHQARAFVYFQF